MSAHHPRYAATIRAAAGARAQRQVLDRERNIVSHPFSARDDGPCLICGHGEDHAIHTVAFRRYLPAEWLDEMVPELGNSPSDFLRRDENGELHLSPIEEDNRETWDEIITPGKVVAFEWTETYDDRVLTWDKDGNWSLDAPAPATANCFRPSEVGDFDDIWNDLGELVQAALSDRRDEYQSPMVLEVYGWQDAGNYRVKVLESGVATFEPVPAEGVAS
jgi:hypothetical protein